jgi:hypothetical protein
MSTKAQGPHYTQYARAVPRLAAAIIMFTPCPRLLMATAISATYMGIMDVRKPLPMP